MSYRVLVINPGSTSTKFAVYEDENPILVKGIEHNADEISKFNNILDQYEMRKEQIHGKENLCGGVDTADGRALLRLRRSGGNRPGRRGWLVSA